MVHAVVYAKIKGKEHPIKRKYTIRRPNDYIKVDRIEIKEGITRHQNEDKIIKSNEECVKIFKKIKKKKLNKKKECKAPMPRYYGWAFKNNGVQTGCITAQNVFSKEELKFAKEYLKWMKREIY